MADAEDYQGRRRRRQREEKITLIQLCHPLSFSSSSPPPLILLSVVSSTAASSPQCSAQHLNPLADELFISLSLSLKGKQSDTESTRSMELIVEEAGGCVCGGREEEKNVSSVCFIPDSVAVIRCAPAQQSASSLTQLFHCYFISIFH